MRYRSLLMLLLALNLPAFGQTEQLVGTWEHQDTSDPDMPMVGRVVLRDNGTFDLEMSGRSAGALLAGQLDSGEDAGADPLTTALLQAFPDSLSLAVRISGVWQAEAPTLHLDAQTSEITLNGQTMQAFFDAVARRMAALLAEQLGITPEDYPAFEEQVLAQFDGEANPLGEEFSPDEADLEGTYELRDGVLYITDEDGETTDWHPSTLSAVAALSWGQLKALPSRR